MSRQRSPRAGHVVLDLSVFDSQPADDTRLASPAPYPYWSQYPQNPAHPSLAGPAPPRARALHADGQLVDHLVERWFAALTEKQLRRGVHRSTRELEAAIRRYIDITNTRPKPFVWTKTADEILASVARFCHRISNSGH
jgi:hypothetical protein